MQSAPSEKKPKRSRATIVLTFLAMLYFVLLGCIVAYVWLLAQDRFLSLATFKISQQSPTGGGDVGIAQLAIPGLADAGSVDSQIAIGFINSTNLLLELEKDKDFNLQKHYSTPAKDFVFRMAADAPLEKRLEYYRKRIFATYDKDTGLTTLTVDTFDPALSKKLADHLLERTEAFINTLNQSVADHQLVFVRGEVERAEKNVRDISLEILNLQNSNNLVDPDAVISASLKTLQELRMDKLRNEATLASIERDSPGSPRIDNLRSHLRSIDEQIAIESTKISGPEKDRLNQLLARFKELDLKLEFANKMRTGAITLLEKNRIDTIAQSRFLSMIQSPYLPEDVGYPQRTYATITIILLGILLFFILRVLVQSVLERF